MIAGRANPDAPRPKPFVTVKGLAFAWPHKPCLSLLPRSGRGGM